MPFLSKSSLLDTLTSLGIRLDKSRGQCYLIDQNMVEFIITHANLDPENDIVMEIGPGLGTLSDYLIQRCKQVILIEFDNKVAHHLKDYYSRKYKLLFLENPVRYDWNSIDEKVKIILIHGDALKVPFPPANKIVANIPYQISAPLIFRIIEYWSYSTVNLMVQREFAERLLAPVNSKNYSRISAATGLFLDIKKVRQVPASCFYPSPRVNSMLIEISAKPALSPDHAAYRHRTDYLAFLRGIFPYKNKSIRNAITHYLKREPHVKEKLAPLMSLLSQLEQYSFLRNKLRSFSPTQLFSLMLYGLTNDQHELRRLLNQFSKDGGVDIKELQTVSKHAEENLATAERINYYGTEIVIPKQIYKPAEDTDLSIQFLRSWLRNLSENQQKDRTYTNDHPLRVLEMGCGSGALSFFIVSNLTEQNIPFYHMGIDINPLAVQACHYSAELHNLTPNVHFKCGSFFDPLLSAEERQGYDIVIFNPPYLASESDTIDNKNRQWIDLAWEGGPKGSEVTVEFFKGLSPFLNNGGEIVIISSRSVNQEPILSQFRQLEISILKTLKTHVFFEDIILYHGKREC